MINILFIRTNTKLLLVINLLYLYGVYYPSVSFSQTREMDLFSHFKRGHIAIPMILKGSFCGQRAYLLSRVKNIIYRCQLSLYIPRYLISKEQTHCRMQVGDGISLQKIAVNRPFIYRQAGWWVSTSVAGHLVLGRVYECFYCVSDESGKLPDKTNFVYNTRRRRVLARNIAESNLIGQKSVAVGH